MKKNYLLAMTATAMFAACSQEATVENGTNETTDRVAVSLGTEGVPQVKVSRAPLEQWNNTHVGIFAMAKNTEVAWDLEEGSEACLLNNLEGNIQPTEEAKAPVEWVNGNTYYYPITSTVNYSFYGYYPYVENVVLNENSVVVNYDETTFNGTQDILCGYGVANDASSDYKGYNATYLRKVAGDTPSVKFNHQLVRLNVYIKKGQDADGFKITGLKFKNAPKTFSIVAADKEVNNVGTITYSTDEDNMTSLNLKSAADETEDASIELADATEKQLVGYIMLPANMLKDGNFEAVIAIAKTDGTPIYQNQVEATRTFNVTPPTGKSFVKGAAYNINLTVSGPKEISVDAELGKWTVGGDSDIDLN